METRENHRVECAVVFCGGRGSRLGKVGQKKNKSLLLIKNKPIIFYIINKLLKEKIDKIVLPLGYKGSQIKKYVMKEYSNCISKFIFINTGRDTEISGRINKIKKYLPQTGSILILNGDTIFDFKLSDFFLSHKRKNKNISLATFDTKIDLGLIQIKENKPIKFNKSIFVTEFQTNKKKYLAYSGFFLSKSKYLKNFNFNPKKDFELEMFNKSIKSQKVNFFQVKKGLCFSIDNVKSLQYANNFLNVKNLISY